MSKASAQTRPVFAAAARTCSRTRKRDAYRFCPGPPGRSTTKCCSQTPSIPYRLHPAKVPQHRRPIVRAEKLGRPPARVKEPRCGEPLGRPVLRQVGPHLERHGLRRDPPARRGSSESNPSRTRRPRSETNPDSRTTPCRGASTRQRADHFRPREAPLTAKRVRRQRTRRPRTPIRDRKPAEPTPAYGHCNNRRVGRRFGVRYFASPSEYSNR